MTDYPSCRECLKLMRPKGTLARNHPGTVSADCDGLCGACYRVFTRARKRASNDPKIRRDKANTDAFLQQIRETRQRMERRQKIRMVTR